MQCQICFVSWESSVGETRFPASWSSHRWGFVHWAPVDARGHAAPPLLPGHDQLDVEAPWGAELVLGRGREASRF